MSSVESGAAAHDQGRPEKRVPGEIGVWVFILGDMLIFALFFFVYMFYRTESIEQFRESQQSLNVNLGAINTIILLTSSWFVVSAVEAVRRNRRRTASRLFLLTFASGVAFGIIKIIEYGEKISAGITLNTNDFFMYYYMFTGIHFLHVIIGTFVLIFLYFKSRASTYTNHDIEAFESGASYWHMVDLLWIILFPLLYLLR